MSTWEKIVHAVYSWFNPAWSKCVHASCWTGANASVRLMNILSPHINDAKFKQRVSWMKDRGCDTAHVFVSNQKNGGGAGYCPYGEAWTWKIDPAMCRMFRERMRYLRRQGFAVVPWLFADDSAQWNNYAAGNFPRYLADLKAEGLLALASTVCVGLELNEYFNAGQVAQLVAATRKVYGGKVATHMTSGAFGYAGLGDICFYQVNPGMSVAAVEAEARRVRGVIGIPLNFFEIERQEDRAKSEAALRGGAYAVGNW